MIKSTGYWGKRTPILWKQLNGSKSPPKKQSTEYMRWNRKKKPSFKGKIAWMLLEETKLHWIVSTNHMGPGVSSSRKSSASATGIFFFNNLTQVDFQRHGVEIWWLSRPQRSVKSEKKLRGCGEMSISLNDSSKTINYLSCFINSRSPQREEPHLALHVLLYRPLVILTQQ